MIGAALEGLVSGWTLILLCFTTLAFLNKKTTDQMSFFSIFKKNLIISIPLGLIVLCLFILLIDVLKKLNEVFFIGTSVIVCSIIVFVAIFMPKAINKFAVLFNFNPLTKVQKLLISTLLLTQLVYVYSAFYEMELVMVQRQFKNTNIHLKSGEVLLGDKNNYYIGNIENYLFYYHPNEIDSLEFTSIVPMKEVSKIDMNTFP